MRKFRASVLACLVVPAFAALAVAQMPETPTYTSNPPTFAELMQLRQDAEWFKKAFVDPKAALKADPAKFRDMLGKNDFDMRTISQQDSPALRLEMKKIIIPKAKYDPFFQVVLDIASVSTQDRFLAVQSVELLDDALKAYVAQYPVCASASRAVLLQRLKDTRDEVKFAAIMGLALVKNAPGSNEVTQALVAELQSKSEVVIDSDASALGALGDVSAVRPLVERFLSLEAGNSTAVEPDYEAAAPNTPTPSNEPVNEAKLAIAVAVDKLAGLKIGFSGQLLRSEIMQKYAAIEKWWAENKDKYK